MAASTTPLNRSLASIDCEDELDGIISSMIGIDTKRLGEVRDEPPTEICSTVL